MANAAWAFVNPLDTVKGAEYWNTQKWTDLFNQQKLDKGAADAAYLDQLRPMTLKSTGLALQGQTQTAQDAADAYAVNQILRVPAVPGESQLSVYQKQAEAIANIQDPALKYRASMALDALAPGYATALANRGLTTDAVTLSQTANRGASIPSNIYQLPAGQQYDILANRRLTGRVEQDAAAAKSAQELAKAAIPGQQSLAKEKVTQEAINARFKAEQALKQASEKPAAVVTEKEVFDQYNNYYRKVLELGITPMTLQEYKAYMQYTGSSAALQAADPITGAGTTAPDVQIGGNGR